MRIAFKPERHNVREEIAEHRGHRIDGFFSGKLVFTELCEVSAHGIRKIGEAFLRAMSQSAARGKLKPCRRAPDGAFVRDIVADLARREYRRCV